MTSKISFLKLMQEDAKRRNWMLVFLSVLFFVCYPVLMMIALDAQTTVNDIWRNRRSSGTRKHCHGTGCNGSSGYDRSSGIFLCTQQREDGFVLQYPGSQKEALSEWIYDRIFDVCRDFSGV